MSSFTALISDKDVWENMENMVQTLDIGILQEETNAGIVRESSVFNWR